MKILQGDDKWRQARDVGEERGEGFVSAISLSRARGRHKPVAVPGRKEPPQSTGIATEDPLGVCRGFRHRGSQDIDERPEGPRRLRFAAFTDEDARALGTRAREECTQERGLAYAGVARDKDDASVARSRPRECRLERAELVFAAYEVSRDKPAVTSSVASSDRGATCHARILAGG